MLIFLIILFLTIPSFVFARKDSSDPLGDFQLTQIAKGVGLTNRSSPPQDAMAELATVAGSVIQLLLGIVGLFFFLLILYSGVVWMTSRGNEEVITRAKSALQQAVWGFLVVSAAYTLVFFVVRIVTSAATPSST